MKSRKVPAGVENGKFDEHGKALPFFGNTVICHINDAEIYPRLCEFYAQLADIELVNSLYTLLPSQSYHITLFDGACKKSEEGWYWPSELAIETPLTLCTDFFAMKIREHEITSPVLNFSVNTYKPLLNTLAITAQPTGETVGAIPIFRNRLADAVGIRRSNHDNYVYHITLGYFLRAPSQEEYSQLSALLEKFIQGLTDEERRVVLHQAELCQYDNITEFSPKLFF
ncbi:hypothetical protein Z042_02385 [Chania multitudinisentens RB-25]|uniref:DUF1868 domain-containing protein n=1 Tax=Chania multitudinisentens RB-25 TaxID=1441930 RepID=W0LFG2_9GAMM|nr:DUF1868 domain-containing protein [Chania multitudinisentens]AHG22608.1 hypothetical protein Z042_02385 [Chania multitudinisentens RB-25]